MNTKTLDDFYYNFNPSGRTVNFSLTPAIKAGEILMIVNLTKSIVIYNFASQSEGGIFNNNVLSLTLDTTAMSASDKLMVIVVEKEKEQVLLQQMVDLQRESNELLFEFLETQKTINQ